MSKENELEEAALEAVLVRFKNGKMKLTRPIKAANGTDELKEITLNETQDASFYMNMPLEQNKVGDFLEVIADVTGLTTSQVMTLHKEDYMSLVIYVGKF